MNTEIVSALIGVAGVILSGVLSWFVSRASASKEIEKLKLEWAREDRKTVDGEFAEMAAAVSRYVRAPSPDSSAQALSTVAALRAKETGGIAYNLDYLYDCILDEDTAQADDVLSCVLNKKRERKCEQDAERGEQPKKK